MEWLKIKPSYFFLIFPPAEVDGLEPVDGREETLGGEILAGEKLLWFEEKEGTDTLGKEVTDGTLVTDGNRQVPE